MIARFVHYAWRIMEKFVSDRSNWTRNIIHPRHSLLSFFSLSLSLQSPLSALWCPIHPAPEPRVFVLLVFYGVARLTQDKIGLWYDHETHLFIYIVCTLWLLSFPLRCAAATCITYVRLDPSTC